MCAECFVMITFCTTASLDNCARRMINCRSLLESSPLPPPHLVALPVLHYPERLVHSPFTIICMYYLLVWTTWIKEASVDQHCMNGDTGPRIYSDCRDLIICKDGSPLLCTWLKPYIPHGTMESCILRRFYRGYHFNSELSCPVPPAEFVLPKVV
jgi:hypothetical protein